MPRVRFGEFELDENSGELWKDGARQVVAEQPFALLRALLARPGDLVGRDELRQRLWPAETFVDFEHGLNAAVKKLRDVLGDSADSPRFIETIPRRGYRFVARVKPLSPDAAQPAGSSRDLAPNPTVAPGVIPSYTGPQALTLGSKPIGSGEEIEQFNRHIGRGGSVPRRGRVRVECSAIEHRTFVRRHPLRD